MKNEKHEFTEKEILKCEFIKEEITGTEWIMEGVAANGSVYPAIRNSETVFYWQFRYKSQYSDRFHKLTAVGQGVTEILESAKQKKKEEDRNALIRRESKEVQDKNFKQHFIDANFGKALQYWFNHIALSWDQRSGKKPSTYDRKDDTVRAVMRTPFSKMRVSEIGSRDLDEFFLYMRDEAQILNGAGRDGNGHGYSIHSVRKMRSVLKEFFKYYYNVIRKQSENPMLFIEPLREKRDVKAVEVKRLPKDKRLSTEQMEKILLYCANTPTGIMAKDGRYNWLLPFMGCTGLRIGELLGLKWGDIDFENGFVRVRRNVISGCKTYKKEGRKRTSTISTPKSIDSIRDIPLTELGRYILTQYRKTCKFTDKDDFICATKSGSQYCSDDTIIKTSRRILLAIGIPQEEISRRRLATHCFRHTFGSLAAVYAENSPRAKLALTAAMGHSSPTVTNDIYIHSEERDAEELRECINVGQSGILARLKKELEVAVG